MYLCGRFVVRSLARTYVRGRRKESDEDENESEIEGKNIIIVDDMIDTAGTLCKAAQVLKNNGAASVRACATHGILSGEALKRIHESALEEVYITDTVPHPELANDSKIRIVSMTEVFANIINKVYNYESLSSEFII